MKKILFVDDETRILDGLRRMLRPQRKDWYMLFVGSGEEALEKLKSEPFDVIVSDMRMPGMDGAALLGKVQELYPDTVRIVLSGHTELEAALRAIPIAHQFLSKPCDSDTIKDVIERACNLNAMLNYDSVRRMVGKIKTLPALPSVYAAVVKELSDPNVSVADIANAVEQDMSISARILQTVNSGFFGLRQQITSIQSAISYLGLIMVKNLILGTEVFESYQGVGNFPAFSLREQQQHGLLVAHIAAAMFDDTQSRDDAFIAGLMHDIGKIVLAAQLPDHFDRLCRAAVDEHRVMQQVEMEISNVSHAEIGAYLLGLWGMPYSIVEAVAHHHEPRRVEQPAFGILAAIYTANILAHEVQEQPGIVSAPLDTDLLESLGVAERLLEWRETARELAEEKVEMI